MNGGLTSLEPLNGKRGAGLWLSIVLRGGSGCEDLFLGGERFRPGDYIGIIGALIFLCTVGTSGSAKENEGLKCFGDFYHFSVCFVVLQLFLQSVSQHFVMVISLSIGSSEFCFYRLRIEKPFPIISFILVVMM